MYYRPYRFLKFLYRFDKNWLFFFVNVLLVVLGYWIANTAEAFYAIFKLARIALLLFSIFLLYTSTRPVKYLLRTSFAYVVPVFGLLFVPSVILTERPLPALFRLVSILIYLFYLEYFFRTNAATQSTVTRHFLLIEVLRLVYFLPVLIYLVNTPALTETNIYGDQDEELGLTSNNFGWAASFYFLLTIDRLKNFPSRKLLTYIDLLTLPLALYLVIITGSRSSVVAIAIGVLILILFRKNISFLVKAGTSLLVGVLYLIIITNQDLALNRKNTRSGGLNVKKESRLIIWNDVFSIMAEKPQVLLFGVGPENSRPAINKYRHRFYHIHPHNTYIIVLFESGVFCFIWFMLFLVIKPLLQYVTSDLAYFAYVLHPFIISFFDHNLGPGQFMAFPFFSLVFFYLYRSSERVSVREVRSLLE